MARSTPPSEREGRRVTRSMNGIDRSYPNGGYGDGSSTSDAPADASGDSPARKVRRIRNNSATSGRSHANKTANKAVSKTRLFRSVKKKKVKGADSDPGGEMDNNTRLLDSVYLAGAGPALGKSPVPSTSADSTKCQWGSCTSGDAPTASADSLDCEMGSSTSCDTRAGQDFDGVQSWEQLGSEPARFEANERRRLDEYMGNVEDANEARDLALLSSVQSRKGILGNAWEDQILMSPGLQKQKQKQKQGKKSGRKVQAGKDGESSTTVLDQQPLEGAGKEQTPSPVYPIAPPNPDSEFGPYLSPVDESDRVTDNPTFPDFPDLPEIPTGRNSMLPVPHPPMPTHKSPRSSRPFAESYLHTNRHQTLLQRHLSLKGKPKRPLTWGDAKSVEEMSVFVDWDAGG